MTIERDLDELARLAGENWGHFEDTKAAVSGFISKEVERPGQKISPKPSYDRVDQRVDWAIIGFVFGLLVAWGLATWYFTRR